MKKLFAIVIAFALIISGCTKKSNQTGDNKIVLGVSPVPHAEIAEALKDEFKKEGLELEIKVFDDYVQPNLALDQGDIDANFFQHEPYLKDFCEQRNLNLVSVGNVHIEPIGFYSTKIKSIDDLKDGDSVLIPNDATNGKRALLLLEREGVITLKTTEGDITEKDIDKNPKNLKFEAADAANLTNLYQDVTIAAINTNYALMAELKPSKDALILEDKDSPYANIIAVKAENKDSEKIKKLVKIFNSDACKNFINEKYADEIFPAF